MIHVRRFAVALTAVLVLFGLYVVTVAPLFEPPPTARKTGGDHGGGTLAATQRERGFEHLFAEGSWELDNPKVVENGDCTLLIQDYKPLDDGRMELRPCTLIFYVPNEKAKANAAAGADPRRPVVLRAPQGAILQFDKPLDLTKAEFGRLMGGKLAGEISITSPPSAPNANDALRITTRNVQIDTDRAFTPHDVEFQYGSSFGRGRDLTIFLKPREQPAAGGKSPPVGGVRAMQLAHVEHLHLELDGPGLLPDTQLAGNSPPSKPTAKKSSPLEVRCKGPLVYDFEQKIIAVDDQVELSRLNPRGPADRLLCSRLVLYLAPDPALEDAKSAAVAAAVEAANAPPAEESIAGKLQRVIAVGSPVILEAPSSATFVVATRIEYSPPTRRLALESGAGAKQVVLERGTDKFEARQLQYELAEKGRLGRLWAAGPGRLRMAHGAEGKQQTISAEWQKELRIRPDEACHVISLVDGAAVDVDAMGRFSADQMHVWVKEVAGDASAAPGAMGKGKTTIIPDRMQADGNVEVNSPQLQAKTKQLKAWFVDRPPAPATTSPMPGPLASSPLGPGGILPAPAAPPPGAFGGATQPEAPRQRFVVVGDLVQMQVARLGAKSALEDLTIEGGVVVEETQTKQVGEAPLRITGDVLQLHDGASDNAKLEVHGKPAEVSARGLTMSGPAIHLLRGENRLWIEGPGRANLPAPSLNKSMDRSAAPPERMDVSWQQGMTFDGSTALLRGEVRARGATQRTASETLEVTLARPINFAKPEQDGSTEVARLKFDGGVYLENNSYTVEGTLQSIERMEVRNLSINRQTGAVFAQGPGWMTTIRKGNAAAFVGGDAPPRPAAPAAAGGKDDGLTHLHITFQEKITGDVNKHEVTFHTQVKCIYASVQNWDDRITMADLDRDKLAPLGEKGALLSTDQLTIREMPGATADGRAVELEALGNTLVEGQLFTARAHRISYATAKDQLVIESDGRNDAELWRQQTRGGPTAYSAARKITVLRKTNEVIGDGWKVIDVPELGGKPLPSLRRR